jgi:hypothetical protein
VPENISELAEQFMTLFSGFEDAYGTFEITDTRERDGKQTGKVTLNHKKLTVDTWKDHLNGKRSLGIVPIRSDSTVYFGAIDIDDYTVDRRALYRGVEALPGLPLVLTTSKSGGVHAWLFCSEPCPAGLVRTKLQEYAAALGYGRAEIFPKQSEVLPERGDIGSWINMPYFGDLSGNRTAFTAEGEPLSAKSFLQICALKRVSRDELRTARAVKPSAELSDGPPCLQHLVTTGFPQGTRNNGLFGLGVYARKKHGSMFGVSHLEEYNTKYFQPPLAAGEVREVEKSVLKKEYAYNCSQPPLVIHCNAVLCRTRQYGVGDHTDMPVMSSAVKFNTVPPIWFITLDDGRKLKLDTESLQSQLKFQRACMEFLNKMPPPMNSKAWQLLVQNLLAEATVIEPPPEASPEGMFGEYFRQFVFLRPSAKREDLARGKVIQEGNVFFFRMKDLMEYLKRAEFKEVKPNEIASILRTQYKAEHTHLRVKVSGSPDKNINVYKIEDLDKPADTFTPPEVKDAPY